MSSKTFNTTSVNFKHEDSSKILMWHLEIVNMILMWRTIVSETNENLSVLILRQLDVENNLEMTICLESTELHAILIYFLRIAGVEISESQLFTVDEDVINMDGTEALDEWRSASSPSEILYLSDFIIRPFIEISGIWPCYEVK